MKDIIEYITSNWEQIALVAASIMMSSRLIVKLTPTPKDDKIVAKIIKGLRALGLEIVDKPKK